MSMNGEEGSGGWESTGKRLAVGSGFVDAVRCEYTAAARGIANRPKQRQHDDQAPTENRLVMHGGPHRLPERQIQRASPPARQQQQPRTWPDPVPKVPVTKEFIVDVHGDAESAPGSAGPRRTA